jgi:hypothetical protein
VLNLCVELFNIGTVQDLAFAANFFEALLGIFLSFLDLAHISIVDIQRFIGKNKNDIIGNRGEPEIYCEKFLGVGLFFARVLLAERLSEEVDVPVKSLFLHPTQAKS